MAEIIRGLSNEEYHHGEKWADYLSSSQLKHYLKSPKSFRYAWLHPEEEKNENLEFGSLFHSGMEAVVKSFQRKEKDLKSLDKWEESLAEFEPPINEKTGQPYGSGTKAYTEAYAKFVEQSQGKTIVTASAKEQVEAMLTSLYDKCGETSNQVRKLSSWAKEIETSYFYETPEGIKLKIRPDLLTGTKLVDWKTCSCDLDQDSLVKHIIKYRYDVSLAMYQWVLHEITGEWYRPYLVFISKKEPYEAVMVDMSLWCYDFDGEFVAQGIGAVEFKRLLDLHTECIKNNEWPGVESLVPEIEGVRILKPEVPNWFQKKYIEEF